MKRDPFELWLASAIAGALVPDRTPTQDPSDSGESPAGSAEGLSPPAQPGSPPRDATTRAP